MKYDRKSKRSDFPVTLRTDRMWPVAGSSINIKEELRFCLIKYHNDVLSLLSVLLLSHLGRLYKSIIKARLFFFVGFNVN